MNRILVTTTSLLLMMSSLQSCHAEEKQGEEQQSDIASQITNTVEEELYDAEPESVEEKKEDSFDYNTNKKKDYLVTIFTEFGEMQLILFDETTNHKKNFVKLASEGFYDSTAFHRVMNEFMIQGGDPNSKGDNTNTYGQGGPGYTIPAEFNSKYIHKKGALAAARTGGASNPLKASSGSQFYIVEGKKQPKEQLKAMHEQKIANAKFGEIKRVLNLPENKADLDQVMKYQQEGNQAGIDEVIAKYEAEAEKAAKLEAEKNPGYTEEQLEIYSTIGGTPFLDMEYTVYGEVIKGLEVVDKITQQSLGGPQGSLPNEKITMTVKVELLKKKKITKLTGYEFE